MGNIRYMQVWKCHNTTQYSIWAMCTNKKEKTIAILKNVDRRDALCIDHLPKKIQLNADNKVDIFLVS